jgi:hypothetical protein
MVNYFERHVDDAEGNPAGGVSTGFGFTISWQNGPMGQGPNRNRNGAFVEDVIAACISRLDYYQSSKFACEENAHAIRHLRTALDALNVRSERRIAEGVEGTHAV